MPDGILLRSLLKCRRLGVVIFDQFAPAMITSPLLVNSVEADVNRPQVAKPMSLSFLKCGPQSRAAFLSRAERSRPACSVCNTIEEADEDVVRGPGGPPH